MRTAPDTIVDATGNVDLTPMLDVVFILLIFFIVVASFVTETGIDAGRSDDAKVVVPASAMILVEIDAQDDIILDGRIVDPRALRAIIARLNAEQPMSSLVIRADRQSRTRTLVQVMDASRLAGVSAISLASDDG